jgi:hypothetical protein
MIQPPRPRTAPQEVALCATHCLLERRAAWIVPTTGRGGAGLRWRLRLLGRGGESSNSPAERRPIGQPAEGEGPPCPQNSQDEFSDSHTPQEATSDARYEPRPTRRQDRSRSSKPMSWAWLDLNLGPHPERRIARVINGLCRTKESRAWPGMPRFSHPSWRPPAMGVLSEIDRRAPCYPAFPQLALIHEWHRDGLNHARAHQLATSPGNCGRCLLLGPWSEGESGRRDWAVGGVDAAVDGWAGRVAVRRAAAGPGDRLGHDQPPR